MRIVSGNYILVVIVYINLFLSSTIYATERYYYLDIDSVSEAAFNHILSNHSDISREDLELGEITLKNQTINKKRVETLNVQLMHKTPIEYKLERTKSNKLVERAKLKIYNLTMKSDGKVTHESSGSTSSVKILSE